jgi:ornithine cyclodeaminase/alanine dehydrogenase-like protein (mu-crystallin family)
MSSRFIDREEVARRLTYELCIPIVRDAMIAFFQGKTKQLLLSILPLSEGRLFGVMPGALEAHAPFGAKLIAVFRGNSARGEQSHQGTTSLPGSGRCSRARLKAAAPPTRPRFTNPLATSCRIWPGAWALYSQP